MNNLVDFITPLSRGIIWMIKEELSSSSYYTNIDYLVDGLLTANLIHSPILTSKLIIGKNFNFPLYVMIIKEIKKEEIESFLQLVKKDLQVQNEIAIIADEEDYKKIKKDLKDISPHLRRLT